MATNSNKDQVYPKIATQTVAVFDADSTFPAIKGSKVASLVNAINAKTQKQTVSQSLEHEVCNGFISECSDDELEEVPTVSIMMTRSLGRNEFLRLKPDSCKKLGLSGKDKTSTKLSNASFRTLGLVPDGLKEIPRGKVESNPFYRQDRQRTDMKRALPSIMLCEGKNTSNSNTVSDSKRGGVSEPMSIKMRIKLWSEKEKEVRQQQVPIERRKSAHFPVPLQCDSVTPNQAIQRSASMSSLQVEARKEKDEVVATNVQLDSKSNNQVTAEIEIQRSASLLNTEEQLPFIYTDDIRKRDDASVEFESSSSPPASQKGSPKRNLKDSSLDIAKGLSKLGMKLSPRFRRKKLVSDHQGDKEAAKRIGGRSSKKRKAFKSKVADELVSKPSSDDNIQNESGNIDDNDVFTFEEEPSQRASSLSIKSRKKVVIMKKRAGSQPIDPQQLNLTTDMQAQVQQNATNVALKENDAIDHLPSEFLHSEPSCQHPEAQDHTVSRDIINSLGSASDSEMNIVRVSGPFGSSESSSDDGPTCSIQSCLDKEVFPTRSTLKRRASENIKSSMYTPPEKITVTMRKGSISPYQDSGDGLIATPLMCADAVWDRDAQDSDEISFRVDDVIEILDMSDDVWWQGSVHDTVGWFPASFVRLRIGQESDDDDDTESVTSEANLPTENCTSESPAAQDMLRLHDPEIPLDNCTGSLPRLVPTANKLQGNSVRRRMTIRRKDSAPSLPRKLTPTEVRAKVVEEILNTERDYVHSLEDIIEGFLNRCRDYSTLFDADKVETIFSNVEEIYRFQRDFLRELESKVDRDRMDCSEIGNVFVINKHEFAVYSQYCNNHPHAVNEMNMLQQNEQYTLFFESCRLLRNLQDISLEGFLLTPVQKICKYPLQLSELLKYTDKAHPDYDQVLAAQQTMKEVAMQINEQKRRMENIGKIGIWQLSIDGWKGPDILEKSTELIHSGELHKISKGHSQERHFFLFDRQLVYCKKEIGGKLSYKGRLDMEECHVADLPDGSALHGNTPVKNAWRMKNKSKDKWYIIYAKTLEVKKEWMDAFCQERDRVLEDHDKGFHISMKMKRAAVSLVESSTEHIKRRKSFSRKHILFTESVDTGVRQRIDSSSSGKKLAVSGYISSTQPNKKLKGNKKKS